MNTDILISCLEKFNINKNFSFENYGSQGRFRFWYNIQYYLKLC
ncbi:p5 [Diodia vein chlorosis virus]|uniref:p5 n=1 Tax=Diodia vein chlorosis virus TaxID=656520 RepID=E7BKJ8_9CLOS|nr:p5 [Diodia vein chlorosis virus]ADU25034.1 p5 [Diodia vein chlorosis virus]